MKQVILILVTMWFAGGAAAETGMPETAEPEVPGAVERGKQLYDTLCWTCHGMYGRGDGPLARNLPIKPADFTLPATLESRSDDALVKRLRAMPEPGEHTPMVMGRVLSESALRDTLAYVRTLHVPGKHVSVAAGRDIYNGVCWSCHGRDGDGKGPAAESLEGPKPRDFTSAEFVIEGREAEIFGIISYGAEESFHGSPYMLNWGDNLSPQQIRDVIEYLRTFKGSDG